MVRGMNIVRYSWSVCLVLVLALLSLASTRQLYSSEGVLAKGDMTFPSDLAQLMRYIEEYLYVWDNKVFAGYPRTTLQDHLFWAFSLLPFIVCLPSPWVGPAWISFLIFHLRSLNVLFR